MATLDEVLSDLEKQIKTLERNANRQIESEIKKELVKFGQKLEEVAKLVWDEYLASYQPTVYRRTGKTRAGIQLNPSVSTTYDGRYVVKLEFKNSNMFDSRSNRHTYLSIDKGWNYGGKRYMYDYYEGFDLIAKTIGRVERIIPAWMSIETVYN